MIIVYVFEIKMDAEGRLIFLPVAGSHILHSETTTKLLIDLYDVIIRENAITEQAHFKTK